MKNKKNLKSQCEGLSQEELQKIVKHNPNKYEQVAIDFKQTLSKLSPMVGLDGFAFPETMSYIVGDMFKLPLDVVKGNALKLFNMGHTSFETEFDYGCSDQYSHVFYNKEDLCFVKRDQNISYVVIFEKDTKFSKGDIHIRKYWDDTETSYYMNDLKDLSKKLKSGVVDLKLLNEMAGLVHMLSDSTYKKDYQKRPNLENVINGVGMKYKDSRDVGYIGSFEDRYETGMKIDKGYNINTLSHIVFDMQSMLEE